LILLKEVVEKDFENYYFNKFKVVWEAPREVKKNPKEYYAFFLRELIFLLSKEEEIRHQLKLIWDIPTGNWGDMEFHIGRDLVVWVDFDNKGIFVSPFPNERAEEELLEAPLGSLFDILDIRETLKSYVTGLL